MKCAALTLIIVGALLTLGGTGVVVGMALRDRHRLKTRIADGMDAIAQWMQDIRTHDQGSEDPDPGYDMNASAQRVNEDFEGNFETAVGRKPGMLADGEPIPDTMLLPEVIALHIVAAQIRELGLPAVLVFVGILASTVGSVLSLFA